LPFDNEDNESNNDLLFKKILFGKIEYPDYLSDIALDLLLKILVHNPAKRITIKEIKQHPFYLTGKKIYEKLQESLLSIKSEIANKIPDNDNNDNNTRDIYSKNNNKEKRQNNNIFKSKCPNVKQQIVTISNKSKDKNNLTSMNKRPPKLFKNDKQCVTAYSNNIISKTECSSPLNIKLIKSLNDNISIKQTFNSNNRKSDINEDLLLEHKYENEKIKKNEIIKNIMDLLPKRVKKSNKDYLLTQFRGKENSWDYPYKINKIFLNKDFNYKTPNRKPLLKIKIYNSIKRHQKNTLVKNNFFTTSLINQNKTNIKMNDKLIINLTNEGESGSNKSSLMRINHKLQNLDKRYNFFSPLKIPNIRLNTDDTFPLIRSSRNKFDFSPINKKLKLFKYEKLYLIKKSNNIENMPNKDNLKYFYNKKYDLKFPYIKIIEKKINN
jgi:hypothetical protein